MKSHLTNFVLNTLHRIKSSLERTDEGGRTIRYSRFRKFRKKNKGLSIFAQLIGIWYLAMFAATYFTGDTGAKFNDVEVIENSLHAKWDVKEEWDESSLKFLSKTSDKENCLPITAAVENGKDSGDMQGPVKYEVYWIDKGNPQSGPLIEVGEIPPIKKGETFNLEYQPTKNGNFMFKAYQRPMHPGKGVLWSEEIKVESCSAGNKTDQNKNEKFNETKGSSSETENQTPQEVPVEQTKIEEQTEEGTEATEIQETEAEPEQSLSVETETSEKDEGKKDVKGTNNEEIDQLEKKRMKMKRKLKLKVKSLQRKVRVNER
ncbi:amyloid fiber anchoring/assembly protein TapA [Bacillus sp. P14.5]|uniref:amyloid fiber anchoring/assembly protein TapA n=1 Tax=Bacillus sp. P14.5 TaxID=1983400 RepID=UPI000DEB8E4B|nr:amyloid fiber anchoring/assembly protein TapA [Bacillus sp. P14.5]